MSISEPISSKLVEYLEKVKLMSSSLTQALDAIENFDLHNAYRQLSKAIEADTRADRIRRDLSSLIITHGVGAGLKNRLMHYLRMIDRVAEKIKEAARYLEILPYFEIPIELRKHIKNLSMLCANSIELLLQITVNLVRGESGEVRRLAVKIEAIEEAADEVNEQSRRLLIVYGSKIPNPAIPAMLRDFIESLEEVTDYAEDVADLAMVMLTFFSGSERAITVTSSSFGGGSSHPK
ncbi:MAG: hypothetical protein DRO12_02845 [Thermoprotei archaeon]|nr:MAG: hypothetical protein DRO12_02845 [Thermoprotei archaeon]